MELIRVRLLSCGDETSTMQIRRLEPRYATLVFYMEEQSGLSLIASVLILPWELLIQGTSVYPLSP